MKKLLALLIAVAMTVTCFAACGKKTDTGSASDKHDHTYGEWEVVAAATCTEDGTKTATCEFCGATDTVIDEGSKLVKEPASFFERLIEFIKSLIAKILAIFS